MASRLAWGVSSSSALPSTTLELLLLRWVVGGRARCPQLEAPPPLLAEGPPHLCPRSVADHLVPPAPGLDLSEVPAWPPSAAPAAAARPAEKIEGAIPFPPPSVRPWEAPSVSSSSVADTPLALWHIPGVSQGAAEYASLPSKQLCAQQEQGQGEGQPRLSRTEGTGAGASAGAGAGSSEYEGSPHGRLGGLGLALAASLLLGLAPASQALAKEEGRGAQPTSADEAASQKEAPDPGQVSPAAPGVEGEKEKEKEKEKKKKTRVVVLGSGWGAIAFLKQLDTAQYEVLLISPRNFFLFTPLLPQVTVGTVEARSVAEPVRRIIRRRNKDATFLEAECVGVDPVAKTVRCREAHPSSSAPEPGMAQGAEFEVAYDRLVVAVGAEVNTFNTKGVREYCHFLKEIEHAEAIQGHIVDLFEAASMPGRSEEEQRRLLTFVVVGGGPSGVEFAAELHDLITQDLSKLYPQLKGKHSINLVEATDHILNMFDKRLTEFAEEKFARDGIVMRKQKLVVEAKPEAVLLRDMVTKEVETLPHGGFVVWATGIRTRPLVLDFMTKIGQSGRRILATDEWLRVKGAKDVWALGDCATIQGKRMRDNVEELLRLADTKGTGVLDEFELQEALKKLKDRFPQLAVYLQRKKLTDLLQELEVKGSEAAAEGGGALAAQEALLVSTGAVRRLSIKKLLDTLEHIDNALKSLPATAQVAAQQGEYLAHCFNKAAQPGFEAEGPVRITEGGRHHFHPFRYRHMGQFAAFGTGQAGVQLPGDWVSAGRSTQWLWYSVYASKQVSWRTRALVVFDWCKKGVFGRDSSRL